MFRNLIKSLPKRSFATSVDYLSVSNFTPELKELRDQIRKFSNERIAPLAASTDKTNQFPMHLWREMGEMGVLGITAPSKYPIFFI